MCILFLHYHPISSSNPGSVKCSSPYLLVAADNRDEFFERPTNSLAFWGPDNSILAGQDVQKADQGTWLGVSRKGRFAVLTNYRTPVQSIRPDARTRGLIVSEFLSGTAKPETYCKSLVGEGKEYNGFSVIVADLSNEESSEVVSCSNRGGADDEGAVRVLEAGNYGLSNSVLDCPWRKVQRGKIKFEELMKEVEEDRDEEKLVDSLLKLLADDTCLHPDPSIPDTGFPEEVVKPLSSIFVQPVSLYGHQYGTRTSSVVLVDRNGNVSFTERTLTHPPSPHQPEWTTKHQSFTIQGKDSSTKL